MYIGVRTLVSIIAGVTHGFWFYLFGVDFAFQWGVFTFVLNYIPNLGPIVAMILPILQVYLQFDVFEATVITVGLIVIEEAVAYGLDPYMEAWAMRLSPVIILISVVFWAWIWGVWGAFLAPPIMVAVIAACARTESLKPIAVFLSRSACEPLPVGPDGAPADKEPPPEICAKAPSGEPADHEG